MDETIKLAIAGRFKNTEPGFLRIKRNLGMNDFSDGEIENLLRKIILATPEEFIETRGKNHYFKCPAFNAVLTVHSHSYTIITAKRISQNRVCCSRSDSRP